MKVWRRATHKKEDGGVLLILMVWVAIMSIFAGVAYQSWSIVWRRDNEEELIFRGHQYIDAIIAYRKEHNKQFPGTLDELMKPGPRQVRYIRKLFKDPVAHNGKWGLLYLMPGGAAIYDPVAAQKGKAMQAENPGQPKDDMVMGPSSSPGVTPIMMDPNGAMGGAGMAGMSGAGAMGGQQNANLFGGAMGMGGGANAAGAGGMRTGTGSMPGGVGGVMAVSGGGTPSGMNLPPPKPASDDDEKSVSEPPIGWPIVGVISRITGKADDDTYKTYQGHEHVSEWQFHVFEHPLDQGQAPMGVGASNPNCVGPGYGGCGPIGGLGSGLGNGDQGSTPGLNRRGQRPGGPGGPGGGPGFGVGPGGANRPPPNGGGNPPPP